MKAISDFSVDEKEYRSFRSNTSTVYQAFNRATEYAPRDDTPRSQVLYRGRPTGVILSACRFHFQFELAHGFLLIYSDVDPYDEYRVFIYLDRSFKIRDAGSLIFSHLWEIPGVGEMAAIKSGEKRDSYQNLEVIDDRTIEFDVVPRGRYRLSVYEKPHFIWARPQRAALLRPWGSHFRGAHIRFRCVGPWRNKREVLTELKAREKEPSP